MQHVRTNTHKNTPREGESAEYFVFGRPLTLEMLFHLRLNYFDVDQILGIYGIRISEFCDLLNKGRNWWYSQQLRRGNEEVRRSFLEAVAVVLPQKAAFFSACRTWIEAHRTTHPGVRAYFDAADAAADAAPAAPPPPKRGRPRTKQAETEEPETEETETEPITTNTPEDSNHG